jgi:hypothetical protein
VNLRVVMCTGFIKFMECYYMILVTKRRQIGSICGHAVYSIEESQLITVPHPCVQTEVSHSKEELRLVFSFSLDHLLMISGFFVMHLTSSYLQAFRIRNRPGGLLMVHLSYLAQTFFGMF